MGHVAAEAEADAVAYGVAALHVDGGDDDDNVPALGGQVLHLFLNGAALFDFYDKYGPEQEIPEIWHYNTLYRFTVFARLKDGTFMAAGEGAGDKEIRNLIGGGDLSSEVIYRYSDTFVPIQIE